MRRIKPCILYGCEKVHLFTRFLIYLPTHMIKIFNLCFDVVPNDVFLL